MNTDSSLGNCGACGNVCSFPNANAGCLNGNCFLIQCNPGFGNCDFMAANGCETITIDDPDNCGTCFNVCPPSEPICSGGVCQ